MGIATRFVRLMKADVHALLDQLEDPEAALRQAVREMEELLVEQDATRVELIRKEEQLERARVTCEERLREYQRQLDLCLDAENDALARSLIKKRLEVEQRLRFVGSQKDAVMSTREAIEREMAERREKLAGVVEKMQLFATSANAKTDSHGEDVTISEDQVEIAFLEEKRRRKAQTAASPSSSTPEEARA